MGSVIEEVFLKRMKALRSRLHGCPELAMQERETREILISFVRSNTSLNIVDCGAYFYCCKKALKALRTPIGFRADFDAVEGRDGTPGHYCGHDGHATVLAGLGILLEKEILDRDVYFFFQPAEEIGQGGPLFEALLEELGIEEVYGFHNIPGYPEGVILLRNGTFACGSTGLEITYTGRPSHAAYPESGVNPGNGIRRLMNYVEDRRQAPSEGMILATLIGIEAGSQAYGVSASEGKLRYTIRGERDVEFRSLVADIIQEAGRIAVEEGMQYSWKEIEAFPATENASASVEVLRTASEAAGLEVVELEEPFRWSEDFGYFLHHCKGAMFGVGAGLKHPALHTEDYEFNDEIMSYVWRLYLKLLGVV